MDVDLSFAFAEISRQVPAAAGRLLAAKETLLDRPLRRLLTNPHGLGGFLGRYHGELGRASGRAVFIANPVRFLERLYHFLDLEERPEKPPSEKIWYHDQELLQSALSFYAEVERRTGASDLAELTALFAGKPSTALVGSDTELWARCQAAHRGHQLGLELLLLLPQIGLRSGFLDLAIDEELQPVVPEPFSEPSQQALLTRLLAPPHPAAAADEIVTPMGGTFYAREAPHLPPLVGEGDHFEVGQPLFVIEVMKMFNKVLAPFSGTVVQSLMRDRGGTVVKKGQVIFRIEPDERLAVESPEAVAARRRATTLSLLGCCSGRC